MTYQLVTISVPAGLLEVGNMLMAAADISPGDGHSFTTLEWAADPEAETGYALISGLFDADFIAALQGDALRFTGEATADTIAVRIDIPAQDAIEDMGLVAWDDPNVPVPVVIDRALLAERARMLVSRLQGRLTLGPQTVEALDAIAADPDTPWAMRETINNAIEWRRTSQAMDELGYVLGYTPEQMDDLFRIAATVVV